MKRQCGCRTLTAEEVLDIERVLRLAERILKHEPDKLINVGQSLWTFTEVRKHLRFAANLCSRAAKRKGGKDK